MALFNLLAVTALVWECRSRSKRVRLSGLLLALCLLLGGTARAQTTPADTVTRQPVLNNIFDRNAPQSPPPANVANPGRPSIPGVLRRGAVRDSSGLVADTSRRRSDSLNVAVLRHRAQVSTTVKYAAKDSIQFDVDQKTARLYNKSTVDYGAMNMKAALITVNYGTNEVQATGRLDTVKHKTEGVPLFKDEAGTYSAGTIRYNFKTKKGKIADVVTQQGDGYIHAEVVKKLPNNDFYGKAGRYTTCNLAHPHFYIEAPKMKVIPGEKVITGPFHLVIADIPLPIGLPFGYFPQPHGGRSSGVIIPTFGQGAQRGYSLSNGGYYWAPNDYLGVRITGDIYAGQGGQFGGFNLNNELTYRKRYKYSGSFRFSYAKQPVAPILGTEAANSSSVYALSTRTFWVSWAHTPTPLPGGGVFAASVQAGSSSYNRVNTLNARQLLSASFSSSISYSKQSRRLPINYSIQLAQSQNTQTGVMDFTLPNFSVGVARQYPYQWLGIQPRGRFYEQFAISYNLVGQNKISSLVPARSITGDVPLLGGSSASSNIPVSFSNAGALLRNAQNGLQHQFQITLPSFALLQRHIQVQPSVQYGETWYLQSLEYKYRPTARAFEIDTVHGFNRAYSYSASMSATTNIYGIVQFKGNHFVKAIRHKMTPSLSYSYSPDLSKSYPFQALSNSDIYAVQSDYGRLLDPRQYSRYQGFVYGTPTSSRVSQVGLSIQNSIEMKVRNSRDTTGTQPTKKVSLADGLDLSIGYNLAADSLRLSPLNLGYRVQIAKKLNVVATSQFTFYQRDSTGRLRNHYLFEQDKRRLARLTSASLSLGYQFNPAARPNKKSNIPRPVAPSNDPVLGSPRPVAMYADYVDFDIPWEASLQYTASYTTASAPLRPSLYNVTPILSGNSITASGSVKLTENLRFSTSLNLDLRQRTLVYPTLNFFRDLHCWQISGLWIPVGEYRGYQFTISAKSGQLAQALKLNRNKTILNR